MKLSEQLKQDHECGDFGKALAGYAERAEALEKRITDLEKWLQWCLDNCDGSPEWNFGTDATDKMRDLLVTPNVELTGTKQRAKAHE